MARTRYTLDAESGILVDRDGNPLGRVVSITIDDRPLGGQGGNSVPSPSTDSRENETVMKDGGVGETRPTPSQLQREAVTRCWDYWLEISGKKQRLDAKRERILRNALGLVGEEAVKRALLGLTRSPWHNGQNEQRKTYLEIRYGLRGIGDESDDERIEKAISWAAQYAPGATEVEPAKVERWLEDVRYTLSLPHRPERERATDAYRRLRAAGFTIVQLDKAPWARIER